MLKNLLNTITNKTRLKDLEIELYNANNKAYAMEQLALATDSRLKETKKELTTYKKAEEEENQRKLAEERRIVAERQRIERNARLSKFLSAITELRKHALDVVCEYPLDNSNISDLQHFAFNHCYYIIGHDKCYEWLDSHNITPLQAMRFVEISSQETGIGLGMSALDMTGEELVNNFVYYLGNEVIPHVETIDEFYEGMDELETFFKELEANK